MSWSLFIYLDSRLSKNGPSNSCWKLESLRPWFYTHMLLLLSRFGCVRLCATPKMAAHQAPPSLGFSRQEHGSRLLFPSPTHESEKWKWSRSAVSNSSQPHGLQPTRLLRPREKDKSGRRCQHSFACVQLISVLSVWYSHPQLWTVSSQSKDCTLSRA